MSFIAAYSAFLPGAFAETIRLAWDPSPDTSVVGYVVYYGEVDSQDVTRLEVGDTTVATLADLIPGATYFIYTTAISSGGVESVPSNLLTYTPQAEPGTVPPQISNQPTDLQVTEGDPILLTVTATGTDPLTYQWQRNGVDLVGATSSALVIDRAAVSDSGSYTVRIQNPGGRAWSDPVTIWVQPKITAPSPTPPIISSIPSVSTAWDKPVTVNFTAQAPDGSSPEVQVAAESSDPGLIPATGLALTGSGPDYSLSVTPTPGQAGFGIVTVRVTDAEGQSAVATFGVTVTAPVQELSISLRSSLTTQENVATPVERVHVVAPGNDIASVWISAESLNPDLIPSENVLFGGTGTERYMVVIPGRNQHGTATVQVHAYYNAQVVTETIQVTITPVNEPPSLRGLPPTLELASGQRRQISFQVDAVSGAAVDVKVAVDPPQFASVVQHDGSGAIHKLVLSPDLSLTGSFQVTVAAQDASGLITARKTMVTVSPPVVRLERSGDRLTVVWPNVSGLYLESSSDVSAGWTRVNGSPSIGNGECRWTVAGGGPVQFFRASTGAPVLSAQ